MSNYKRFTENKPVAELRLMYNFCKYNGCENKTADDCDRCYFREVYEKLSKLEDKIEQGLMFELPCKVGDIIYAPHWHFGEWDKIVPYQITNITITQNKKLEWTKKYRAMEVVNGKTIDWQINFAFDEIGEKIFLDKVKAEQKLKEVKKEGK